MPASPETKALLEQAISHVLKNQRMVLKHKDSAKLIEIAEKLGMLVEQTWDCLCQGLHKVNSTSRLTGLAKSIEQETDKISKGLWTSIPVDVSCVYERVEQSFRLTTVQEHLKLGMAVTIRNHFHNTRILLLEQLLGARMLINNNDLGAEAERIWQQFFERELGPGFRVLQGGHIFDHDGKHGAQVDLIVVSADAQVITPGNSHGGKANVLVDQVVAAFMVASTLTTAKFREDWEKLSVVASLYNPGTDFPNAKDKRWPLCYIVAGKAEPLAAIEKAWQSCVGKHCDREVFGAQLAMALDSGFVYSGASAWPCPGNAMLHPEEAVVYSEEGIYAGLGLAWILTQVRMRAKLIKGQPVHDIVKFGKLLDDGSLKSLPATFSMRFRVPLRKREIAGCLTWGGSERRPHNRLELCSLERRLPHLKMKGEFDVLRSGDSGWKPFYPDDFGDLRWFNRNLATVGGRYVVLEEWFGAAMNQMRHVIFDSENGIEVAAGDFFEKWKFEDWTKALEELSKTRAST